MAHERSVAVVGLGYVGLPVAAALGRLGAVIGFDRSSQRIEELRSGYDRTGELSTEELQEVEVEYSDDEAILSRADFFIVAVPTPIDDGQQPAAVERHHIDPPSVAQRQFGKAALPQIAEQAVQHGL